MAAARENKYSVIIPTYNERQNIPILIWLLQRTFNENNLDWEVIVVDDNSPDGTQYIVNQLVSVCSPRRIKICSRPTKLGLGTAYVHGLNYCTGDFVVIMDADLSHHPKCLPLMIEKQKEGTSGALATDNTTPGYDIVTGTRYALGGGVHGWNLKRKLASRAANYFADILLNPGVSDLTGSFRLYKREVLQQLIATMKSQGYAFQMEVMVLAKSMGYSVAEVPICFVDRIFGDSKFTGIEIMEYVKEVVWLWINI